MNYLIFRFIKKHYNEIKMLFQFDSQLLTLIPYICPQKETHLLCEILPLELSIVWLIERLNLSHTYNLRLSQIEDSKVLGHAALILLLYFCI